MRDIALNNGIKVALAVNPGSGKDDSGEAERFGEGVLYTCGAAYCPTPNAGHPRYEASTTASNQWAMYASAAYLIPSKSVMGVPTYLEFNEPSRAGNQYRSSSWRPYWRLALGNAAGAHTVTQNTLYGDVYTRPFVNAVAYLNNKPCRSGDTLDEYAVTLPAGTTWYDEHGDTKASSFNLHCKQGQIVWKAAAFPGGDPSSWPY